jgi:hypothetical protein
LGKFQLLWPYTDTNDTWLPLPMHPLIVMQMPRTLNPSLRSNQKLTNKSAEAGTSFNRSDFFLMPLLTSKLL